MILPLFRLFFPPIVILFLYFINKRLLEVKDILRENQEKSGKNSKVDNKVNENKKI